MGINPTRGNNQRTPGSWLVILSKRWLVSVFHLEEIVIWINRCYTTNKLYILCLGPSFVSHHTSARFNGLNPQTFVKLSSVFG
ncbi:hypothetical protein FKM82_010590 [Ascaphus truei]